MLKRKTLQLLTIGKNPKLGRTSVILIDTTFLIDLSRNAANQGSSAINWLNNHSEEKLGIPAIVLGEFSEGFVNPSHPLLLQYRLNWDIVPVNWHVALCYGRISRLLRGEGKCIGANDTWIAATALHLGAPLLTRNVSHFGRIGGITLIHY